MNNRDCVPTSERMWCWDYELKGLGSWPDDNYKGHNKPVQVILADAHREGQEDGDAYREVVARELGLDHDLLGKRRYTAVEIIGALDRADFATAPTPPPREQGDNKEER